MLSQNVQWLEVSCDLDLDPSLTSNWNKLKRLQELVRHSQVFEIHIVYSTSFFLLEGTIVIYCLFRSGMSPWGYRGLSWFHCTLHETLIQATACKISIKHTCNMTDLRWLLSFLPNASHQEHRLADLSTFLNLRKRFIRIWIVQRYSWNSF